MDASLAETLAGWRRHLHAHPELSLQEKSTAAFVCAKLTELGIPFVAGVGGHGVVATIARGQSNRSVGLRADMDALPITETTGLPYASTNPGAMHACGHDGHTTSLLGAAALLARDTSWTGTVQLVFQPAEEGYGGARSMIDDGLFTRFPMERIFGYHNWPGLDAGTVAVHDSAVMAGGTRLAITLEGHSGHAAMPHLARDPMLAAGHLLVALQSVVSRNIDPLQSAVVSVCMVEGGVAANQIPSQVTLRGTCRTFNQQTRDALDAAIHRVTHGIAATFGMKATIDLPPGIGATVNSRAEADLAAEACAEAAIPVRRDLQPAMTSEDFGWFLQERPGAFVWIGNGPAEPGRELHNDGYDFNDAILPNAATYLASIARRSLRG
ncbi:amidohydrolase [Limobrevibacterium gyesilva]|uniref:Amidohydrolase n=1 Tax=Limobrevibacterium gyesilva TaxID=2991712 RepID=A0AA41YKG1_9PROT|nr:amidohydrolase [Limobrevibacterium gyesilva]MCW3473996.1 amidohydrolase [Limobrevibacterium gyesilva]